MIYFLSLKVNTRLFYSNFSLTNILENQELESILLDDNNTEVRGFSECKQNITPCLLHPTQSKCWHEFPTCRFHQPVVDKEQHNASLGGVVSVSNEAITLELQLLINTIHLQKENNDRVHTQIKEKKVQIQVHSYNFQVHFLFLLLVS